jgi:hypothetical protein
VIHWLYRVYRRIGIHTAPPGTLFFWVHSLVRRIVHWRIFGYASGNPYTRARFGGIPYYDIRRVRKTKPVDGLALVFFMGAGDYLMTTPLVEGLHLAYPDLPIYAYGSTHTDNVNSPLVLQLLRANPLIDRVFAFAGRPRAIWSDYDFSDALKDIPKDFLILPVFYDVEPVVFHRVTSVLETFGLPVDLPVPVPIAYKAEMSQAAADLLQSVRNKIGAASIDCVVCTHFGARSSGYLYPHAAELIERLIKLGCFVVTFSEVDLRHDNLVQVDTSRISATDSIELLRALVAEPKPLFAISVNSLMWPITAALAIPNLGMHTFWDPTIHQYLYPNIYVVTQHLYEHLPPSRCFLAPRTVYRERKLNGDTFFTDYHAQYVIDCFQRMRALNEA